MLLLLKYKDSGSDNKQQSNQGNSNKAKGSSINETITVKIALQYSLRKIKLKTGGSDGQLHN